MKIHAIQFGIALALTFAIIWVVCSLLVWLLPAISLEITGHMVHANLAPMGWHLSLSGVLIGLVGWSLVAGITGFLLAYIYNCLTKK